MPGNSPRPVIVQSQTIIRPSDTTAYASGDLVANSTTAGSVTPFLFTGALRAIGYKSTIRRVGIFTSLALLANGTFRVHFFKAAPTVTGGDNATLDVASNLANHLGWMELVLSAIGTGQGSSGWSSEVATAAPAKPSWLGTASQSLWALLEARAAYVPASAQTFRLTADIDQY